MSRFAYFRHTSTLRTAFTTDFCVAEVDRTIVHNSRYSQTIQEDLALSTFSIELLRYAYILQTAGLRFLCHFEVRLVNSQWFKQKLGGSAPAFF